MVCLRDLLRFSVLKETFRSLQVDLRVQDVQYLYTCTVIVMEPVAYCEWHKHCLSNNRSKGSSCSHLPTGNGVEGKAL